MKKFILLGLGVYTFASSLPVLASKPMCGDLVARLSAGAAGHHGDSGKPGESGTGSPVIPLSPFEAQVNYYISSPTHLRSFLEQKGDLGIVNRQYTDGMANALFKDLGPKKLQEFVQNLLLNPKHISQKAIHSAFVGFARGEVTDGNSLNSYVPKAANDEKTVERWKKLGKDISHASTIFRMGLQGDEPDVDLFLSHLTTAIKDFKSFEYVYGEHVNVERSYAQLTDSLAQLNDPLLVGRFMELFLRSDRLTRQYILEENTKMNPSATNEIGIRIGNVNNDLKGTERSLAAAKSLDSLFAKSLDQLQEEAYFLYTSNGIGNRPQLTDLETTKNVALRFLKRMQYNLTNLDIHYAAEVLSRLPIADKKIDYALEALLKSGDGMTGLKLEVNEATYAIFEIALLERNAQHLSTLNVYLTYLKPILSEPTHVRRILFDLLDFHAKYDLRNSPTLLRMTLNYFRNDPQSLTSLDKHSPEEVAKFRNDFGL